MNNKLRADEFKEIIIKAEPNQESNIDYLYEIYEETYEGIKDINEIPNVPNNLEINSYDLSFYILGEFVYSTSGMNEESIKKFKSNQNIKETMINVVADKYLSLSLYNHHEVKLTNSYLPPISSMELYVNLMSNIVNSYHRNDPKNTLIVDLLTKSLSIARCSLKLLCDGYETEAMSMWRTLHECEAILIILEKYGDTAINSYLKHMEYGLVYKDALKDKEKQAVLFSQIKSEMASHDLKSKDMKKFIEYGWMYAIDEYKNVPEFKLNFRDGLEKLAGLHEYSDVYMMSSEILHSTPILIYSSKRYFYYLTLINLYESFFRIEEVFKNLFLSRVNPEGKNKYLEMRNLYLSQLKSIHSRESLNFKRK